MSEVKQTKSERGLGEKEKESFIFKASSFRDFKAIQQPKTLQ